MAKNGAPIGNHNAKGDGKSLSKRAGAAFGKVTGGLGAVGGGIGGAFAGAALGNPMAGAALGAMLGGASYGAVGYGVGRLAGKLMDTQADHKRPSVLSAHGNAKKKK